jgi:hypothetical protein
VGALSGLTALILQLWQLAISGIRIKVRTSFGLSVSLNKHTMIIDVQNRGRLECTIQYVSVEMPISKFTIPVTTRNSDIWIGPNLPLRIAAASNESWMIPLNEIHSVFGDSPFGVVLPEKTVRGLVTLSSGKQLRSELFSIDVEKGLGPVAGRIERLKSKKLRFWPTNKRTKTDAKPG